jgi:acetylornithine deacetylase/succinyl-diaminopimelate desuccinylase-like protein
MFRIGIAFACMLATAAVAQSPQLTPDQALARRLMEKAITFKSSEHHGETPKMAAWLASEFKAAGFRKTDIEIVPAATTAGLIVRYRGDGSSAKAPILFLAHMDVVEAEPADWDYDPFVLTEKGGVFYGRGLVDDKYGVVDLAQTFIRLKKEGFVPTRDLVIAFSGDEEVSMISTRALVDKLKGAEFALNTDAGGGYESADGKPPIYYIQAAEKTYATIEITAKNSGGHSSQPRADNAIYELADALEKVKAHHFPVMWNDITLKGFEADAATAEPPVAEALRRFVKKPGDQKSVKAMEKVVYINATMRTTCVATMLKGGHAENALPQTAMATVNCRIFPGVSVEDVKNELAATVANPALEFKILDEPVESPVSIPTPELVSIVTDVVKTRYPSIVVVPYMEAGGTDGLYFRKAGIPTFGVGSLFLRQDDEPNYHGKNENLRVEAFYAGLDQTMAMIKALAGEVDGANARSE